MAVASSRIAITKSGHLRAFTRRVRSWKPAKAPAIPPSAPSMAPATRDSPPAVARIAPAKPPKIKRPMSPAGLVRFGAEGRLSAMISAERSDAENYYGGG